MNEIIRIENLTHTYGEGTPFRRSAVENLSLDIYRGEFLGLIGHTGSGKSTLVSLISRLYDVTVAHAALSLKNVFGVSESIGCKSKLDKQPVRGKNAIPNNILLITLFISI